MSEYRTNDKLSIDSLTPEEQLALGGLVRVMIRMDGSFSEAEEAQLEEVASHIGGVEAFWKIISRSAQEHTDDQAIRASALEVTRPEIRQFLRDVLEDIARAETIEPAEAKLLDWLTEQWQLPARS